MTFAVLYAAQVKRVSDERPLTRLGIFTHPFAKRTLYDRYIPTMVLQQ